MLTYQNGRVGPGHSETGSAMSPVYSASAAIPSIMFVGHSLAFSDRLLQLVSEEYPNFDVVRIDSLEQIAVMGAARRSLIQIVIGDESTARMLPHQWSSLEALLPAARIVLGYMAVEDAREIMGRCLEEKIELRCLPMKAPIDAWLATLKLISLGQVFVPEELIEVELRKQPEAEATLDDAGDVGVPEAPTAPHTEAASFRTLTKREKEILGLLSYGERNKAIAERLGLSEHTVKLHVHHIFGKIGVQNRTSATHWYLSNSKTDVSEVRA